MFYWWAISELNHSKSNWLLVVITLYNRVCLYAYEWRIYGKNTIWSDQQRNILVIGSFFKNKKKTQTIKRARRRGDGLKSINKATVCMYVANWIRYIPLSGQIKNAIEKKKYRKKQNTQQNELDEICVQMRFSYICMVLCVWYHCFTIHTHTKENQNTFMVNICIRQI